jgi:hypothetical protein
VTRLLPLFLLLTACVEDLDPNTEDPGDEPGDTATDDTGDTEEQTDPRGILEDFGDDDEAFAEVNASDSTVWVHLDLDTPAWVDEGDPAWSLRFQRYVVEVNGGVSGDGGVEVAFTNEDYDAVTRAPADGWFTDAPDGDDDNEDPDLAFDTWWDYEVTTHTLTPAAGTWFVRSVGGETYALEFDGYYSEAGDSGYPSFRWKAVEDPVQ